tara:strand:+ start:2227 stop:4797 length:2571 start_codon:yes stop_codon:yes gene_type:complete
MKNKINIKLLIKIIIFLLSFNKLNANDILIDAKEIDIKDNGNLIVASGNINITDTDNIKITGNKAEYNKINETVEIIGNVLFLDKEKNYKAESNRIIYDRKNNIINTFEKTKVIFLDDNNINKYEIEGEESFFDKNKKFLEIKNKVTFKDNLNNYKILSEKIIYRQSEEIIESVGNTEINYNDNFLINAVNINYNKNKNIFNSNNKTIIYDKYKNILELDSFSFDLKERIFKGKKIKLTDLDKNIFQVEKGMFDLKSNELIGSDFNLTFDKNFFGNPENDPRLSGRYVAASKKDTKMKKSTFTTCKNNPGKCPSWSISANEVVHKKEKKRIEYKNAWVEIYDVPVAYFPIFFHPDPTVERQSGFLFPQFINSSNLGLSTQIPYFKAIDQDKDLTISPRVYANNNLFLQTEYRQAFKNSKLITDFSYNKKDNSNSHFFSNLSGNFENSFYEMKVELTSNEDYLKKYQINSPLVKSYSYLNSSFKIETVSDESNFSTSIDVIEDLTKNDSDRYEYIFPNYEYNKTKNLNNNFFEIINYNSSGSYRKYDTNVDEADFVNDLIFSKNDLNILKNTNSEFKFLVRNVNTYGDLSDTFKDDKNYSILSSILYNLNYPLKKETENSNKFLTPIASFRYSPNKGLNLINEKTLIRFQDLTNLDRINNKTVEEGISATLGMEYKNQDKSNNDIIDLGFGINFRTTEDKDLPISSSLNKKTSDIIGYSGINITENLSFNYDFSIDQSLNETNYSLITAAYKGSKLKTSFEYLEKSKFIGDESYLTYLAQLDLDRSNSIALETNKNLDKNLTNYYNIIYEYKNDCLKASVIYNKQFYNDKDINSGQNIFFKISLLPFGSAGNANSNE